MTPINVTFQLYLLEETPFTKRLAENVLYLFFLFSFSLLSLLSLLLVKSFHQPKKTVFALTYNSMKELGNKELGDDSVRSRLLDLTITNAGSTVTSIIAYRLLKINFVLS